MKPDRYTFESLGETKKINESFNYGKETYNPHGKEENVFSREENVIQSGQNRLGKEENDEIARTKKIDKQKLSDIERKTATTSTAVKSTAVAVSTVVIVAGGGMILMGQSLDLPPIHEFVEVSAESTAIYYKLALGNEKEDAYSEEKGDSCDIYVELKTESYLEMQPITNFGLSSGRFENLVADTEYTLGVYQNSLLDISQTLIMERTIRTASGDVFNLQKRKDPLDSIRYYIDVPGIVENNNDYYIAFTKNDEIITSTSLFKKAGQRERLDINLNNINNDGTYDVELREKSSNKIVMSQTYNLGELEVSTVERSDDVFLTKHVDAEYYARYSMYIDTTKDTTYLEYPQVFVYDDPSKFNPDSPGDECIAEMFTEDGGLREAISDVGVEGRTPSEEFGQCYIYILVYDSNQDHAGGGDDTQGQNRQVLLYDEPIPVNFNNMPTDYEERVEPVVHGIEYFKSVSHYGETRGVGIAINITDPQFLYFSYHIKYWIPDTTDDQEFSLNYPYYSYGVDEILMLDYSDVEDVGEIEMRLYVYYSTPDHDSEERLIDTQTITPNSLSENAREAYAAPTFHYSSESPTATRLQVSFNIPEVDFERFEYITIQMTTGRGESTVQRIEGNYTTEQLMEEYEFYLGPNDIVITGYFSSEYGGGSTSLYSEELDFYDIQDQL